MVNNILATDIKNHFDLMQKFEDYFLLFEDNEEGKKNKDTMRKNFMVPKSENLKEEH